MAISLSIAFAFLSFAQCILVCVCMSMCVRACVREHVCVERDERGRGLGEEKDLSLHISFYILDTIPLLDICIAVVSQ